MKHRAVEMLSAGAMSDIAFLLLIFFVTTTQILDERGIQVVLPAIDAVSIPSPDKEIIHIHINAANEILAGKRSIDLAELQEYLGQELAVTRALQRREVIISLHCDRGTSYETFIAVYDSIRTVYGELWNAIAQQLYNRTYAGLTAAEKQLVQQYLPLVISEAEWIPR